MTAATGACGQVEGKSAAKTKCDVEGKAALNELKLKSNGVG